MARRAGAGGAPDLARIVTQPMTAPTQGPKIGVWPVAVVAAVLVFAAVIRWAMNSKRPVATTNVTTVVAPSADSAPVASIGPAVESHPRFARQVNAGFMQIVSRTHIRLRVHERGAGETLACGTGACAAVVAGIRLGLLDSTVDVDARGGRLTIEWAGGASPVLMTGPAVTVFEGEIEL